jgi:hypothetical protein
MLRRIIVMCSTLNEAQQKCNDFFYKYQGCVRDRKRNPNRIILEDGTTIFFRGETEGQIALRGYHATVYSYNDLIKEMNNYDTANM